MASPTKLLKWWEQRYHPLKPESRTRFLEDERVLRLTRISYGLAHTLIKSNLKLDEAIADLERRQGRGPRDAGKTSRKSTTRGKRLATTPRLRSPGQVSIVRPTRGRLHLRLAARVV